MQAFPWALDVNTIQKLESAKSIPSINLLSIPHAVDPHLQLTLVNYILLSLDCLSKLAGVMGEYSIQNFNRIKQISDGLQEVAALLAFTEIDREILTTKLDHMIFKLILLNNELADMLYQSSPAFPVIPNIAINDFCHINEFLAHKLLGIAYQKSILTPMDPFSTILDQVSPKLKEDFLRHSGIDASAIVKLSRQKKQSEAGKGSAH